MKSKIVLLSILLLFFRYTLTAQIAPDEFQQYIRDKDRLKSAGITHPAELREFYTYTSFCPVWIEAEDETNRKDLLSILKKSALEGLNEEDYQYQLISSFSDEPGKFATLEDSFLAEVKFSDAAIHFFSDLAYGNTKPSFGYDGLKYKPGCYNIPQLLANYCAGSQLPLLYEIFIPPMPEIRSIREKISILNERVAAGAFTEEKIVSSQVNHLNKPLLKKLYYLGISDSIDKKSDASIRKDVKEAQRQFDLMSDGVLRSTALAALNIPLSTRIQRLKTSINYYRWLYCLSQEEPSIVVNIPAAYLKVYGPGGVVIEMRMIVGKPSTPTPTLTSRVNEVILYPYWMVPRSIAVKELLPAIRRNPGYVDANNYQLINSQGRIVSPYKVDWGNVNASNFPYRIRQSTGCDNALGVLKLNFYSSYGVYLHDTPSKSLFMLNKRYFSHGCLRMEKPIEMGHLVLKNNRIAIDTLTEKGCLRNQSPIHVPADEKMPVIVWYNPAGVDSTGRVILFDDVYKKFR